MRVFYALGALGPAEPLGPAVGAISSFDGVHRGHQRLGERAAALAEAAGVPASAVVLWEGERSQEEGGQQSLLTLLDERLALLASLGLFETALVLSHAPAAEPPSAAAILELLRRRVQPTTLVLAIEPGMPPIAEAAARTGVEYVMESVDVTAGDVPAPATEHGPESVLESGAELGETRERTSTDTTIGGRIADLLLAGDVRGAATLLGHPYGVTGDVVLGDRRGRVLGYPTANLRLDARKLLPADGIYAVRARLPGEPRAVHWGVASLGVRPQFGGGRPRLLEVYLLDAALDLYGLPLGVEFIERLREERRFTDVEALKAQMARDVEMARDVLNRAEQG